MNGFSPTETATEGLRLTRLRSRAVLVWAVAYLGFTILLGRIAEITLGPHSAELIREIQQAKQDPDVFWPLAGQMWPFFAVALPVHLAFQAILTCAIYRAILHPEETGGGYVRIGADELRMAILNLVLTCIWTLALFVVGLVALLMAVVSAVAGSFVTMMGGLLTLAVIAAVIWVLVRLSLAGAITFSERRIQVWASWGLTRGRFWPLVGAYLLAFLLWLLLILVMRIGFGVLGFVVSHMSGVNFSHPDPASADPLIFLAFLVTSAGTALILTCSTVFLTAPPAEAYRELTEA